MDTYEFSTLDEEEQLKKQRLYDKDVMNAGKSVEMSLQEIENAILKSSGIDMPKDPTND